MSPHSSEPLRDLFIRFWEFAERSTAESVLTSKPLLRVRENWRYWTQAALSAGERDDATRLVTNATLAEQEQFVEWVEGWIGERIGRPANGRRYRAASQLVLMQLAHMEGFEAWPCLSRYRLEDLRGVNSIILRSEQGGSADDVTPLAAFLLPRERGDADFASAWFTLEPASKEVLTQARASVLRLFGVWGLLAMTSRWLLNGERRHWANIVLLCGWLPAVLLWSLPYPLLSEGADVARWFACMLFAVWVLLALYAALHFVPELFYTSRWRRLLRGSQLCVLARQPGGEKRLRVEGDSFCLALRMTLLSALHREAPAGTARSRLWGPSMAALQGLESRVCFTGGVGGGWRIGPIKRLQDKLDAAADAGMEVVYAPARENEWRPVKRRQPSAPPASFVATAQAAGGSELSVRQYGSMVLLLVELGRRTNLFTVTVNVATAILFVIISADMPDILRNLSPPPAPAFDYPKCLMGHPASPGSGGKDILYVSLKTPSPSSFIVRLNSHYWVNREERLMRSAKESGVSVALFEMDRKDNPDTNDYCDGDVLVIRPRALLWREVAPLVVAQDGLKSFACGG